MMILTCKIMASKNKKADRLAYRKGRTQHVTANGEIVDDREARRRKLKKRDFIYTAVGEDEDEIEE